MNELIDVVFITMYEHQLYFLIVPNFLYLFQNYRVILPVILLQIFLELLIMLNIDDLASSSSSSISLPSSDTSSSSTVLYTTASIRSSLLHDDIHFTILPNNNKRTVAPCWKTFGFPAVANKEDLKKFRIIPGFVSCKSCFDTYKYIDSSTANLYNHRCYRKESPNQTAITSFIRSPRSACSSSKILSKKKMN